MTLVSSLLFFLLFRQLTAHLGSGHYEMEKAPTSWDWVQFPLIHAFRAADILDLLEAYGLRVQTIQHSSVLAAMVLMAFHLMIDLFVFGVLLDFELDKLLPEVSFDRDWVVERLENPFLLGALLIGIVALPIAVIFTMFFQHWRWADMLLWPVENVLFVVDVTDICSLMHVRLTRVPAGMWTGTMALVFRLIIAALLLGYLRQITLPLRLRMLGGLGLTRRDLEAIQQDPPNESTRKLAEACLQKRNAGGQTDTWNHERLLTTFSPAGWKRIGITLAGLLFLGIVSLFWFGSSRSLARWAMTPDGWLASGAHRALRSMGIQAESAVPVIAARLEGLPPAQGHRAIETLGYLGPHAVPTLTEVALNPNCDLPSFDIAIRALLRIGPAAAPALAQAAFRCPSAKGFRRIHAGLQGMGGAATRHLVKALGKDESKNKCILGFLVTLDPYWYLVESENPTHQELVALYRKVHEKLEALLTKLKSSREEDQLTSAGQLSSDHYFKGIFGLATAPTLLELLESSDHQVRIRAAYYIYSGGKKNHLGEHGRSMPLAPALPGLQRLLNDSQTKLHEKEIINIVLRDLEAIGGNRMKDRP